MTASAGVFLALFFAAAKIPRRWFVSLNKNGVEEGLRL